MRCKSIVIYISVLIFILLSCNAMGDYLPTGWTKKKIEQSNTVKNNPVYFDPPVSNDESIILFWGLSPADTEYYLYLIPSDTPISEVVNYFKIGTHGSNSYRYNPDQIVKMVSKKATKIASIIPCRVIFADSAGLKLKFNRQITEQELTRIEALFPESEAMQAGLDRYISEWDGKTRLLAPVIKENMIHLWWD